MTIDILHSSLFYQLAAIMIIAGILGFIALKLRQPLIVALICTGLLAGPDMLGIVGEHGDTIETLAELGIALLLFMVGLKLDISLIKELGPVALATGFAQVTLTAFLGLLTGLATGFDLTTSAFLGIAFSFSSTIIVVKLLSDKRAIDSLYGKISLGILIVQDIAVIFSMVLITAIGAGEEHIDITGFLSIFVKIATLVAFTGLFIRFLAAPLTRALAKAPELMVIFAIGLAATMAALCHYYELSKELGGLLAGVALASTPQHNIIAARLAPLRDFLLLFFFVGLGSQINLEILDNQITTTIIFCCFVLIGKPLIIMSIMGFMGYRKRTGFMTGISLGQISEFSLIFAAMGHSTGLVGPDIVAMITLTGLITIGISTYAITNDNWLQDKLENHIGFFERKHPRYKEERENNTFTKNYDIIIFGLGRYGISMANEFKENNTSILGVDFDPQAIRTAEEMGISAVYGDVSDPEFVQHLPLNNANTIVFAFQHYMTGPLMTDLRKTLAKILRECGYKGHIVSTSHFRAEEQDLFRQGVDIVLCPFEDAARHGADRVLNVIREEKLPSHG